MANDLDYIFEKFGPETVEELTEFRVKNADTIKAKSIELGLDAPESEGESLEQTTHPDNVPHSTEIDQSQLLQTEFVVDTQSIPPEVVLNVNPPDVVQKMTHEDTPEV